MASESGVVELTNCKGCLKNKISLLKHLSKVPECKSIYTEEELSELKKEAKAKSKKKEKSWKAQHKDHVSAQNAEYYQTKIKSKEPPKDVGKYYSVQDVIDQANNWPDVDIDWNLSVQCRECMKMFKSTGIHMHMNQGAVCSKKYSKNEVERVGFRTYLGTKEKEKVWLEKNKQKVADQKKKWCQENKDKVADVKKEWYQKNKTKVLQNHENHKDFYRNEMAEYYEKNKKKFKKKNADYYQKNKEKILEKKRQRQKEAKTEAGKRRKKLVEAIDQFKYYVKRQRKSVRKDIEFYSKMIESDYNSFGVLNKYKEDIERFKNNCKSEDIKMKIETIEEALKLDFEETMKEIDLEIHFVEIEVEEIIGRFLEEFGQEVYLYTKSIRSESMDSIDFKMAKDADREFNFQIRSNLSKFIDYEHYLLREHWRKELEPLAAELGEKIYQKEYNIRQTLIDKIYYNEKSVTEQRREHAKAYLEKKNEVREAHVKAINSAKNIENCNSLKSLMNLGFTF